MRSQAPTVDLYRLDVAVHELAHWFAWNACGFRISPSKVKVFGYGEHAEGRVRIGSRKVSNARQARGYLVGLLAGREADLRSRSETGRPFHEHTCLGDLETFQNLRVHEWTADVTDDEFRRAARDLVHARWAQIIGLAPRLALRGRL